jgi:hypothetical protein
VRLELKRLIHHNRATRRGNSDKTSRFCKRIDRQICWPLPRRNPRVRGHSYEGNRYADQFLLKSAIIGRYDGKEESEDTCYAKQVSPTHTPKHSKAGERPASKGCQARQEGTDIYTRPHAPTPRNNLAAMGPLGS